MPKSIARTRSRSIAASTSKSFGPTKNLIGASPRLRLDRVRRPDRAPAPSSRPAAESRPAETSPCSGRADERRGHEVVVVDAGVLEVAFVASAASRCRSAADADTLPLVEEQPSGLLDVAADLASMSPIAGPHTIVGVSGAIALASPSRGTSTMYDAGSRWNSLTAWSAGAVAILEAQIDRRATSTGRSARR